VGVHDALSDQAAPYVLGALSPAERDAFELHLAECSACAADVRGLSAVADAIGATVTPAEPPAAVRGRLIAAIRSGEPDRATVPVVRVASVAPWLALAASLALVAAGALTYAIHLRGVVAESQRAAAVLTAPDVARVDLAGQPAAPDASARAFWSRSRGVVFTGSHLPALPAGRVYQLWAVGPQAPTSLGLLRPDTDGGVRRVYETPPDLPKPVAFAVTIEPDGGVPAPTGEKYLVGLMPASAP
jgi:anti-sigma-K factor RskA